ncbi:MAG: cytochrome c [Bryobacteraceae bacterium]
MLAGYGYPATEGGQPIASDEPPPQPTSAPQDGQGAPAEEANPLLGDAAAIAAGEQVYRARCFGCHMANGGSGPRIFRSRLGTGVFLDAVRKGRKGTAMPAFSELLTQEQVRQVHAFVMSRDRL